VAASILVDSVKEALGKKGGCVLGLATGNSPTGLYKQLAKAANAGAFDSSRVQSFNLDEYIGLPGENAQQRALHRESYSFFMIQPLAEEVRGIERSLGHANRPGEARCRTHGPP
jgi:glucosamine-6-phosphate deaminase